MKQFTVLIAVALAGSVLLSGCGKTEQAPPTPPSPAAAKPTPATPPTVATPAAAPQPPKTVVDLEASARSGVAQAMALAKDGKYQDALALLQQKAAEVQGNPEAKSLVDDAIAKIKKMMADAASKAATQKAGGAVGGLAK
jgi:hypothetical protein